MGEFVAGGRPEEVLEAAIRLGEGEEDVLACQAPGDARSVPPGGDRTSETVSGTGSGRSQFASRCVQCDVSQSHESVPATLF